MHLSIAHKSFKDWVFKDISAQPDIDFSCVAEHLSDGVLIATIETDDQIMSQWCNNAWCRLFNVDRSKIIGFDLTALFKSSDIKSLIQSEFESGKKMELQSAEGTGLLVELCTRLISQDQGKK